MSNPTVDIRLPAHFVVFRYKDVPTEWHVTCLEASAFGWGPDIDAAFAHLLKSLQAQFAEAAESGADAVFKGATDFEWVKAFEEGKHPALDDVIVAFSAEGEVQLSPVPQAGARLSGPIRLCSSSASSKSDALSP